MKGKDDLNLQLVQLRRQSRERYLELAGIDPKKVLQIEQEIDGQYEKLASGVRYMLKKAGKEVAEQQSQTLLLARNNRLAVAKVKLWPWWDPCTADARFFSHGQPVTVPGTVNYEAAENIAHLLVDTGPADSPKEIEAEYRFILDLPDISGSAWRYCVCPVVQMNGHWLTWSWIGGCGGTGLVGSSLAKVTLKVEVYQGGLLKGENGTVGYTVLDESVTDGHDDQSGFYYDSEVDGGASLNVKLLPGTDATVVVKCIAKVAAVNYGRAWVDMSTSPQFYFKVPEVHWGLSFLQELEQVFADRVRLPVSRRYL